MEELIGYVEEGAEKFKDYSKREWLESIASMHYLKYILREKQENILEELALRKKYLNNKSANKRALEIADIIERA